MSGETIWKVFQNQQYTNWAHKTGFTTPLYIKMPVLSHESGQSCIRGIDFASFYDFSLRFWNSSDSMGFCFFLFFIWLCHTTVWKIRLAINYHDYTVWEVDKVYLLQKNIQFYAVFVLYWLMRMWLQYNASLRRKMDSK